MLAKFRGWCVSIFLHLTGVRFYSSETLPVSTDIQKFIVKTLHGYEITFTFYKEELNFMRYSFKRLRRYHSTVYVATVKFDDKAPVIMTKYNNVRIAVGDFFVRIFTNEVIIQTLLNVYLDFLLSEMNSENRTNIDDAYSRDLNIS